MQAKPRVRGVAEIFFADPSRGAGRRRQVFIDTFAKEIAMTLRFDVSQDAPAAYQALYAVSNQLATGSLPVGLKHLVDLRVSQMNVCAYCINLHLDWGKRDGESEARLAAVNNWRNSDLFDAGEKAALAWAEALTVRDVAAFDALHAELGKHFARDGIAELTMMVATINAWNRIGIASH